MSFREDMLEMKKEVEELKQETFAMELLKDQRKQNKRLFIIWIITFLTLICVTCYTIWLLNDIGVIEETTEVIQDNSDGYNNYIGNDGDINNGKTKLLSEWCKIYNINYQTAWEKSKKGYSIEKILKLDKNKSD